MTDQSLLTPGAGNAAGIRTERHSHVGRKGDLTVELHFGDFDTGHGRQAALVLVRPGRAQACIPFNTLWQYCERNALQVMVPPLTEQLYGFVTKMDSFRVMDAILDFLDDLRQAPPDPQQFRDMSLDSFLESCVQEGLDFFVEYGGKRQRLT